MSIATHATLPGTITAGDTLQITESHSSYSAASWTLHYVLKNGATIIRLDSTASGTDHAFTAAASVTGSWDAGEYVYQKYVDNSDGERKTLDVGSVRVEPNIAQVDPNIEKWRTILAGATEAIAALASNRVSSYSIAGQSMTLTSVDEAIRLERVAKRRVADLEKEERMAAGLGGRNKVQFRM